MKITEVPVTLVDTGDTNLVIPASGFTADAPFDCKGMPPLSFVTPANWNACTLTFQALPFLLPGVAYLNNIPQNSQLAPVYDDTGTGTLYQVVTRDEYGFYNLPAKIFGMVKYINITSSVPQTGPTTVSLVLTPLWQGIHS